MKIVYIITKPEKGGAQVHLYSLLQYFHKKYNVYLITKSHGFLTKVCKELQIPCYICPTLSTNISFSKIMQNIFFIKKVLSDLQPTIVHVHSFHVAFWGRFVSKNLNIPVIYTVHGWPFLIGHNMIYQVITLLLEFTAKSWTSKFIPVSEYGTKLGRKYLLIAKDKITTIHNGIPPILSNKNSSSIISKKDISLITIARFSKQKDYHTLLKSIRFLIDNFPIKNKITLNIIGFGPKEKKVHNYIQKYHLKNYTNILGYKEDVQPYLQKSDIFLLISNWEGLPISILEAMQNGLPIIATDVGGVKEAVFHNINGLLVKRKKYKAIANSIFSIINNPKLYNSLSCNSIEIFQKYFTADNMLSQINDEYISLTNSFSQNTS